MASKSPGGHAKEGAGEVPTTCVSDIFASDLTEPALDHSLRTTTISSSVYVTGFRIWGSLRLNKFRWVSKGKETLI